MRGACVGTHQRSRSLICDAAAARSMRGCRVQRTAIRSRIKVYAVTVMGGGGGTMGRGRGGGMMGRGPT